MQNAELEEEESEENGVSFSEGDVPDLFKSVTQHFFRVFVQMSSPLSSCLISRLACVVVNWLTMSSAV